jgi:hypothetical protein
MAELFMADRVTIRGPRVDGSYTISFEVGEYEYDKIKDIPKMNNGVIQVEVSNENGEE